MKMLEASPELCDLMNKHIGGPALVAAYAEIDRLRDEWETANRLKNEYRREVERLTAAQTWQPFSTALKDGRWIIARCNDHSALFYISWGRDRKGELSWCSATASYGDGLFEPLGDWIEAPQPGANDQRASTE